MVCRSVVLMPAIAIISRGPQGAMVAIVVVVVAVVDVVAFAVVRPT